VDLALWNVVIVPTSTKEEEGMHIAKHEKTAAVVDTHFDEKQDRVQKWKEAFAELDAQQQHEEMSDEHDLVEQSIKKQPSLARNDDSSVVMANEEEEENAKATNTNGNADTKHNDDVTNTVIMA
jgi:hypothetical protein